MDAKEEKKYRDERYWYFPFKESFQLNTSSPRKDSELVIDSLLLALSNGCFPRLKNLTIDEPISTGSLGNLFLIGCNDYLKSLNTLSVVLLSVCHSKWSDADFCHNKTKYSKSFPHLTALHVIYSRCEPGSLTVDNMCTVGEVEAFLKFRAMKEIRFP
eukprot:6184593-Pleurochrysis_carterae.AAC.1